MERTQQMKKQEANNGGRGARRVHTYRDELRERDRRAVDARLPGGALGCPDEHFRGVAVWGCKRVFRSRCRQCWSRPYGGEEWLGAQSEGKEG